MAKNNNGFILVMTLVMALVMLAVGFVCLKIFLAPYVAIQNDIIKKKEFYMADTAIEVIREQISNIFYNYVDSRETWDMVDKDKYYRTTLGEDYLKDETELFTSGKNSHGVDKDLLNDADFIEKYSGKILNNDELKNTLPYSSMTAVSISGNDIQKWPNSWWNWRFQPLQGIKYSNNIIDTNVHVEAWVEQIKIINDVTLATATVNNTNFAYTYENGKFDNSDSLFLPKELQKNDNKDLLLFASNITVKDFIESHISRRDFVIIAKAGYTGSNIECEMRYYFSLISFSPKQGDHLTFWERGVIAATDITIENVRPMYRLYFRKFMYHWTEN